MTTLILVGLLECGVVTAASPEGEATALYPSKGKAKIPAGGIFLIKATSSSSF